MKGVFAAVLVVLLLPASASAVEIVNTDGSRAEPYATWVERARVPLPVGRITIVEGLSECNFTYRPDLEYRACTTATGIQLRQRCETMRSIFNRRLCRAVFWHELGHHYSRVAPSWLIGAAGIIGGQSWDDPTPDTLDGRHYTHELFSDSYALCQLRRIVFEGLTTNGMGKQNARLCRLLIQAKENPRQP